MDKKDLALNVLKIVGNAAGILAASLAIVEGNLKANKKEKEA